MDERILLEAVVRAGELMLVSGAEVYRVEDTMKHMLARSGYQSTETIVLATGIFVSLDDPDREPLTLAKRISQRSCNINRIYRVNDVSRRFCSGCISAKEALKELDAISREVQYGPWMKAVGFIGVSVFFTPVFGGGFYVPEEIVDNLENLKDLIVYQSKNNENISVEVLYDNEDFWLTQKSMSKLFFNKLDISSLNSTIPALAVYVVFPSSIALIIASLTFSGTGKSGCPRVNDIASGNFTTSL